MEDVGKGTINWDALFRMRKEAGIKHFFVEHDDPPIPSPSTIESYRYLRNLTF